MLNDIKLSLQYILPKLWLTRLAGWGASKRGGWLTKLVIDLFVKYYKVNMQEAQKPDTDSYRTFNDFFIRPLRDGVRPVNSDPNVLTMPADGAISQLGRIDNDKILQAKGHSYTLEALLAGNYQLADQFRNGLFVTIYLSPRDYHRVHMPCNGILREMIYVPGDLFSVNHLTAQNVPNLFARNERVICRFDTEFGPMVQILVGATIVGSIETVWGGTVTPPREGIIKRWTWPEGSSDGAVALLKGQEMGRFKLGSTVINLFMPGRIKLVEHLQNLSVTRIGEPLALSTEAIATDDTAAATKSDVTASAAATPAASASVDSASSNDKPAAAAKPDAAISATATPAASASVDSASSNDKPAAAAKPDAAISAAATPAASASVDSASSNDKPAAAAKPGAACSPAASPGKTDAGRKATPLDDNTKDKR